MESTKKVKKSANRNRRRGTSAVRETPSSAVVYRGPCDSRALKNAYDLHTLVFGFSNPITSSAGGVINTVFDPYSQLTSSGNWSSASALFSSYRILGYRLVLMPINQYNKATATTVNPGMILVDRESNTAITTSSAAAAYGSADFVSLERKIVREVRMNGVDEASFIDVAAAPATANRFFIKLYFDGLTASTNYLLYLGWVVVQFRGIK